MAAAPTTPDENNPLGLPENFLLTLKGESDWATVIKLHAAIEASLNKLITVHLGDDRLSDAISFLDTGDRRKGKMAFILALDLLPSETRTFITQFSNLRNDLVHDIDNINFEFKSYFLNLDAQKKKNWVAALLPCFYDSVTVEGETMTPEKLIQDHPRTAVINAGFSIFVRVANSIDFVRKGIPDAPLAGHPTVRVKQTYHF